MKALNFFGLCTLLLCILACSKSNESEEPTPTPTPTPPSNAPTITIDNSILTSGLSFTDAAGDNSITFTTDADWTLSVAETRAVDWCTPSATSGVKGTAAVKFSVTENTGYDNRKAAVTIKAGSTSKTFTISQKQKDALLVTTDKYEVEQSGATIEVEVKANIDYQIEIDESAKSWITESSTRALTSHKHAFVISASEEYDKREGEIRVISGDKQEIIKVYQAGGAVLLLSQNEYVVSDAGETISVELKSNFDFGVQMPEVDWISEVTDTRAVSTHTLKYDIAPNDTYDSRSAEIIFYDKNSDLKEIVKIEQVQKDALILSKSEYTIPSEGETIEVLLQSNVKFDVSIDADWISQVDAPSTRGLEEYKLYFKVDENLLEEERSANISITDANENLSQIIKISQEKAREKVALMVDGPTFKQTLSALSFKSIEFVVNDASKPTTDYVLLSTSDSYYPIYATCNNGELRVSTAGDRFVLNANSSNMFSYFYDMTLNLSNFDTSNVTDMSYMFYCSYFSSLDLSNLDTSNVTNMLGMFCGSQIITVDLSNFDTSNVIDMGGMFSTCSQLTSLDLTSFDTFNVTNMMNMFGYCYNLTRIDLSSFDTSNVTNMQMMFYACQSLQSLDLSSFNTSNVSNMSSMFSGNQDLVSLDISSFNTSNVIDMGGMFSGCSKLTSLDVTSFNTSNVTDMGSMFGDCSKLTSLDLSNFDTSNVTNMRYMFSDCSSITSLDLSSFNTSNVLDMSYMFALEGYDLLTSIDLSSFDTSNVIDMNHMFAGCGGLTSLDLSNFNTSNVLDMSYMFALDIYIGKSSLATLNLSNFDTSNVTKMNYMFAGCSSLTTLDLSSFDTSKVTDMGWMFSKCSTLSSLDLNSFNTKQVINMSYMFAGCGGLTSLDLSDFDTLNVTDMTGMFYNCVALNSLDLSSFNTTNVTDMDWMFVYCHSLTTLDLSSFSTSNVTDMTSMFMECSSLTTLDMSNVIIIPAAICTDMFWGVAYKSQDCTITIRSDSYQWVEDQLTESYFKIIFQGESIPHDKIALLLKGSRFSQVLKDLVGDLSNIKSIDFVVNETIEPTTAYKLVSTSNSYYPIYATYNNGEVKISTAGDNFVFISDCSYMFQDLKQMTSINFNNSINTSGVTNMSGMFSCCHALTSLDLSDFDTFNVVDMSSMFSGCSTLVSIDLSGFNLSNLKNMNGIFNGCSALTSLNLSGLDTSNVTDMGGMFGSCKALTTIDLSGFNTSNVTNMGSMFTYCTALTSLGLSNFDTSNVTNMSGMFMYCSVLDSIDLSGFVFNENAEVSSIFFGLGMLAENQPIPIYVTQAAFEYLSNPNFYTGISYSGAEYVVVDEK